MYSAGQTNIISTVDINRLFLQIHCTNVEEQIELDGKVGGGSVLRVGIPLAIALGKPLHITNVRYHRKRRGIQSQHQTGINLLAALTQSQVIGSNLGSTEIFVTPGSSRPDGSSIPHVTIPSSGAVSLVFQTLSNFAFAARVPCGFAFKGGGSHVAFSPNFDVLTHVNAPLFKMFGLESFFQLSKPGFYPVGGAEGKVFMRPIEFQRINLEKGELIEHRLFSSASSSLQTEKIAERQISGYTQVLKVDDSFAGYADADSKGATLSAIMKYDTGAIKSIARNYESRIKPEDMGKRAAKAAEDELSHEGAVDEQLADQLLVPLAFAPKGSSYTFKKMYPHVRTNIEVIQQIMGKVFLVEDREDHIFIERT